MMMDITKTAMLVLKVLNQDRKLKILFWVE